MNVTDMGVEPGVRLYAKFYSLTTLRKLIIELTGENCVLINVDICR